MASRFGEYTCTKYRELHGIRWKITESKVAMFDCIHLANIKNPYRISRTYQRKINNQWQFVTCGRTVRTK